MTDTSISALRGSLAITSSALIPFALSGANDAALPAEIVGAGGGTTAAAALAAALAALAPINSQTGTSYTLQPTDQGKVVVLTNAAAIALTVPNSLPAGFSCTVLQGGAGQITPAVASGGALVNAHGYTKSYAQGSVFSMLAYANVGGSAAQVAFFGDLN